MDTKQKQIFQQGSPVSNVFHGITVGTVIDTNDPQQMGRCRVYCPSLGDTPAMDYVHLPWAMYISPFGGHATVLQRGPGVQQSEGSVAYGIWAVPKVAAQVLVFCIDGDPTLRAYFGSLYDQHTPHTMPHGRWMYDDHPALEKGSVNPKPFGPYTSSEKFIEPIASNMREAFMGRSEPSYEWRTRVGDYSVTGVINPATLDRVYSNVNDDKDIKEGDWNSTQGYQVSRLEPDLQPQETDKNYDSQTYSWTTPGFHAISMDDRQENCRMRFRTSAGHQIIMDDTNERIYIATAKGNNWIEIDQAGNIDIFTQNKVNIRAKKDINFTSDETIRMHAKKGIHMYTDDEIRMHAKKDVHMRFEQSLRINTTQNTYIQTGQEYDLKVGSNSSVSIVGNSSLEVGGNNDETTTGVLKIRTLGATNLQVGGVLNVQATGTTSIQSSNQVNLESGSTMSLLGGGNIKQTAPQIHMNSASNSADSATSAQSASPVPAEVPGEQPAFWTNRVPDHEPWARTTTKDDLTHDPELPYNSEDVGKVERGTTILRGIFWRR